MITTQVEALRNGGLEEIKGLLDGHYDELSTHLKHGVELDPQYQVYLNREAKGEVLYITLRDTGRLVGYFVGFIAPGLHYASCMSLQLDIFYVLPEFRGSSHGLKLMNHIETEAKRRKVKMWTMGVKEHHREHMEAMLSHCGFKPFERHFYKWLGG